MTIHPCFIDCDIAKHHLDLFDESRGESFRIDNTSQAIATWLSSLDTATACVAFEATGPGATCAISMAMPQQHLSESPLTAARLWR